MQRRTGVPSRGDLVATLMEAEAASKLTHEELLGYVYILSIAGNETTTKLIGNIVYQLHRHRRSSAT
jgi:cytochrome P450